MVPEGWEQHHLAEICELINGRGFKPHEWDTEGYPIIRIQNLNGSDEFNYFNGDFNPKILVRYGELLFAWSGSRGTSFGPHIWNGPDAVLNYHTWRVVPKEQTSRDFLVQYLRHITTEIEATAHGASALVHTQKDTMERRRCVLPPLPEQRKIAEILSTWDRAIETTEALLTTARTQKRALMQQLLTGKRRFPEFEGQPWREVRLGDMGNVISGGTPDSTKPEYWDGHVQWATPTDITKLPSRLISETARKITDIGLQASAAKLLPGGAILVCTRATIGELAIAAGPICTNQGFKNLVLSGGFDSDFVFYLLQFNKTELVRYACGSTFLELSKKDFEKRTFHVPNLPEQQRIAAALSVAEEEISEHRENIEKLRAEKRALMQQLLTGKRRVNTEQINAI